MVGEEPTARPATDAARQPPVGARPNRQRDPARVVRAAGRPHEVSGDSHPREMTIWPPLAAKQNSAYGPTYLHLMSGKPYPAHWERVADLRVFRTTTEEWQKCILIDDAYICNIR